MKAWRALVRGLAAAAVLWQGLIPAGYMFATAAELASAGAYVVACPAQQPATPAMHEHHHDHGGATAATHDHGASGSHSCPYAVAAAAVLPVALAPAPALSPGFASPIYSPAADFRATVSTRLPPARGPPTLS